MKSGKVKLVWVMPFVLGLLIVAFMLISPMLISGAIEKFHIKLRAAEAIEQLTGGEAQIGNVSAALFPTPHMKVSESYVSIPGKVKLEVKRVEIYPRLLYLLQGKLLLSSLSIEEAKAEVVLPQKRKEPSKPFKLKPVKIPAIWFALPPLKHLSLKDCQVSLHSSINNKPFLVLSPLNLKASLSHNNLKLKLRVQTNYGGEIWAKGEGDLFLSNAKVRMEVTNLQPHLWLKQLGVTPPKEVKKGVLNLKLSLKKRGENISAEGITSIPTLTFKTKETPQEVTVSLPKAEGTWKGDNNGWTLNLRDVKLRYPPAQMSITAYNRKHKGKREAGIEMHASRLDLGALRSWLKQIPSVYHYLHNLFDIVHSGTAKDLIVEFKGERFGEISNIRKLRIDGEVENALVMIPKVKLPVRKVHGTLHMENATITGTGIGGHFLSSTTVENCRFSLLSLKVKKSGMHPFNIHLDAYGNNTLADLMPVLKRVIHDPGILRELNRMEVKGYGKLHLHLGDHLEKLHAHAEMQDLRGTVSYQAIPWPVEIHGGKGGYHNSTVYWEGVSTTIGETQIESLTGSLYLKGNTPLRIDDLRARMNMEEMRYWLNQYKVLRPYTAIFPSTKGELEVDNCQLRGPLFHPDKWKFNMMTQPHNLNFTFTLLPFPATINGGILTLTQRRLSLKKVKVKGGESVMVLSGWIDNYLGMPSAAKIEYSGTVGGPLYSFLAQASQIPKMLWLNTPFVTTGVWSWKGGPNHTLRAEAKWSSGESATIDMHTSQKGIYVNEASISARGDLFTGRMTMPFDPKERMELSLNGKVNYMDVDNVFVDHGFLTPGGSVRGKEFHSSIDFQHPKNSIFKGRLQAKKVRINGYFIKQLQAQGTPKGLRIDHASFLYSGGDWNATATLTLSQPLHLSGMVEGSLFRIPEQEKEKTNPVNSIPKTSPKSKANATRTSPWVRYLESVEGTLALKIDRVEYGNYTIERFAGSLGILGEGYGIEVKMREGEICTIPIRGRVKIPVENHGQNTYSVIIPKRKLSEEEQPRFEKVIPCLFPDLRGEEPLIEGPFRVWGEIKARDPGDGELLNHLEGYLKVKSTPKKEMGLIHKFKLTSKLLDLLNPLDMARNLPRLTLKGIPYSKLLVKLEFDGKTWPIKEMALDGPALKIVATGKLKKAGKEIDATILVGMLKTVNRIIKNIPLVNTVVRHVLSGKHGSILSIPVSVTGPIDDPLVVPLSPTAVGSEVFGIVKRTLGLPVKLLSPIWSTQENEDNKTGNGR